jgi:hypothetical protein
MKKVKTIKASRIKCSHPRTKMELVRFIFRCSDEAKHGIWICTMRCDKCGKEFEGELQ